MRLHCAVRRAPLHATSGASIAATTRPASQGMGISVRATSVRSTASVAMPPSQSVAQPAMDHLRGKGSLLVSSLGGRRLLDTEFFHAAIEGLAADTKLSRSLRHDLAVLGEHTFDGGTVEDGFVGARG